MNLLTLRFRKLGLFESIISIIAHAHATMSDINWRKLSVNLPFLFLFKGDLTWDGRRVRVYFWFSDFYLPPRKVGLSMVPSGARFDRDWFFWADDLYLLFLLNAFSLLLGNFVPIEVMLPLIKPPKDDLRASISLISCCMLTV